MVFSSFIFLLFFLPLTVIGYYLAGRYKNPFLLAASLIFYAWGEPAFVFILFLSIAINYGMGLLIGRPNMPDHRRRLTLFIGVALNLVVLLYFKYAVFLLTSLGEGFALAGWKPLPIPEIALPIGISFFTFQGLSYLIDVYRNEVIPQRNLITFAMYKALFPQLIAGPIVRYKTIASEINDRSVTLDMFYRGLKLFCIGLGKKVLLANPLGEVADTVFALTPGTASLPLSWLGTTTYALQIYFDFSGYSDMAIGLGLILGFHFLINFNYPYIAESMTAFWKRWHISLSTWFRDYLYIPLGGNRGGAFKTYRNLFIVFCTTGIWHGANWTFLIWGLWHGLFLILERHSTTFFARIPRVLSHTYTLLVVLIGWVFFRCDTLNGAVAHLGSMFNAAKLQPEPLFYELANRQTFFFLLLGVVFSTPFIPQLIKKLPFSAVIEESAALVVLCLSIVFLSNATYNAFLYFRF